MVTFSEWTRIVAETTDAYEAAIARGDTAAAQAAVARRDAGAASHQQEIQRVASQQQAPPAAPRPSPAPAPPPTIYKKDIVLTPADDPPQPVRIPDRDVLEFNKNEISPSGIASLLFEAVGGTEIISLVRRDTIEGQNPYYTLISNLSSIRKQFEPTQLIARQKPNQTIFDLYPIDISRKIPSADSLRAKKLQNFFYIDTNGDLVVELDNMFGDEIIQLEIAGSGTIVSESLA